MSRSTTPPERVPTLTEVLDQATQGLSASPDEPATRPAAVVSGSTSPVGAAPVLRQPAEPNIAQAITADLQAHIDRVLDARVRAALEPVLEQLVARVLEEARRELASTLRDGMARALAQQNARHRNSP